SLARATCSGYLKICAAAMVAPIASRTKMARFIGILRRRWPRRSLPRSSGHRYQAAIRHARGQFFHQRAPLGALHPPPAGNFRQCSSAAEAEAGLGIDHTDGDTRCFLTHSTILTDISKLVQVALGLRCGPHPVPALMIGLRRSLRLSSAAAVSG